MDLTTDLTYLKGVGSARARMFAAKGLETVEDLLHYIPIRYEDRSNVKTIGSLAPGEMATVLATVRSARLANLRGRRLDLFEAVFTDGSPQLLIATWFHARYLEGVLVPGQRVALYGKVEYDDFKGELALRHPEFEILAGDDPDASLHVGRVVPIYEAVQKINAKQLRTLLHRLLAELAPVPDPMPEHVLRRLGLTDRWTALRHVHFPPPEADLAHWNSHRSPAHTRLIMEEFFWLECGLELKRRKARTAPGIPFALTDRVRERIKQMLPFKPTGAQKKVLREIAEDMAAPRPMSRLLQGDVGSGKTLVAAQAAIIALENGYQVALLAPTEILAAQHFYTWKQLLGKLGYVIVGLTGSNTAREKTQLKKLLREGLAQVAVGTHALIEEDVEFQKLGLAVVDEQHRFGVVQRLRLSRKGVHPDVLVMTATPIPRTLALTFYGDLDVSVIDELPPGRKPIVTRHVPSARIEQVYSFLLREIGKGRQAYVVYPVIEESETKSFKAAEAGYEHLSKEVFPDLRVGLLHGRMTAAAKEAVMESFKRGETQVLVSTTVIEVGVDVPNATVMVIEQAERFGLAQLHQLRGRVGRGGEQSYCVLVTEKLGDTARERVRALVDSQDGFAIAELDLQLRGPGEFFGTKQSGLPALRFADLIRDRDLLLAARAEAQSFVAHPPSPEVLRAAVAFIRDHWQRRYGLVQVG
ncbi:MAG: ATP-dependent DNA helicase RecG [Bryobacterales bacterium]|nr:ATP-dependent DNA helicase RecG [Bryobacterales bacterium]